jgi:16S rRNA (uracil1498-N3)-methyltransferase
LHRCYAPGAVEGLVELSGEEAHHLARVLRAKAGDLVVAFDGRGHEWRARLDSVGRERVTLELLEPRPPAAEPPVAVTLVVGLLKGDQMNDVVRDATALGAAAIRPFVSAHTAVPERAWHERALARWQRVAVAAAKQCGRAVVPDVLNVSRLGDVLGETAGLSIACVEPAREIQGAPLPPRPSGVSSARLLVGPEGGWSEGELQLLAEAGTCLLRLGPRTLRAETAPTVAMSVLWATWGWT